MAFGASRPLLNVSENDGGSGEPYCDAGGGKCGLVLAGILSLELEGISFEIHAGSSFAFPATSSVRFWTIGDSLCEVICVVAPATV